MVKCVCTSVRWINITLTYQHISISTLYVLYSCPKGDAFQFIEAEASVSTLLWSKQGMHTWVNIVICIYSYVFLYSKYIPLRKEFLQSRLCQLTIFTPLDP